MRRWAWLLIFLVVAGCTSSATRRATPHGEGTSASPTTTTSAAPGLPPRYPFTLPTHGTVMVFGDSWVHGYYAVPITNGFAYLTARLLGLKGDVEGVGGTGYLNVGPGEAHGGGTYDERLARLPRSSPALVLVSGSLNDLHYPAAKVLATQKRTLADFKTRYPKAEIVVVGLGSPKPGYEHYVVRGSLTMSQMDVLTGAAAASEHLNYISPIREAWFLPGQTRLLMTVNRNPHPTNYGHAVFAHRLVADLRALAR